jgi:hypothetical protein
MVNEFFMTSIRQRPMAPVLLFLLSLGFFLAPRPSGAVKPITSYNIDLVAGSGETGFEDGSFTRARFKAPMGLAFSPDSTKLYVADSGNNRIRVIHLDEDNRVDTLAGQDAPGQQNGSLDKARFNQPRNVVYLPGDRLAVNDFGNKLVRLIDLKTGMVSTLAGGPSATLAEGPASQVSMAGIRDMAYLGAADFLFLTDPDKFAVRRLELKTGRVTLIPRSQLGPFHPAALCAAENTLYIGEKEQPSVFALEWKPDAPVTAIPLLTSKSFVLSLAEIHGFLYALQNSPDYPLQRLLPATQTDPITFLTAWGDEVPQPGQNLYPFNNLTASKPGGFVCDPNNEHKLYFTNPLLNSVLSYRDLFGFPMRGGDGRTANGLSEPLYPLQKPAHTFRILYVGDSRSTMAVPHPFKGDFTSQGNAVEPGMANYYPRILNPTKRLELELNALAAMDDQPLHFEVFGLHHSAGDPLFLWPNYEVPDVCKQDDIDLVVILHPPSVYTVYPYYFYFKCPPTKAGIPFWPWDMEYRLKPAEQRIPEGEAREFYELCKKEHLIKARENNKENNFIFDDSLFSKPEFHDLLVRMYGKPIHLLNQELQQIKTSTGQPVRLVLCTTHTGVLRPNPEDPKIWDDVCARYGVNHLDTNDEMTALRLTFYPLCENLGDDHLTPEGNLFFGALLAHDLIRDGYIPWNRGPAMAVTPTPMPLPAGTPAAQGGHSN